MRRFGLITLIALLLTACEGVNNNSVPAYPVQVTIDTRIGAFVNFVPTALNTYVTVDGMGYHYNGNTYPLGAMDATGYGGVVVYINMLGRYDAYDMACPNCALHSRRQPCVIDGIFAECPHCGEQYDLGSGTAVPTKGLSQSALRRLNVINTEGKLVITQR